MRGEISYDLVMEADMAFVEGCYRLPGQDWRVFVFSRFRPVGEPVWRTSTWESGVTGVVVDYPRDGLLDRQAVAAVMARATGVTGWVEVRGPVSMRLR